MNKRAKLAMPQVSAHAQYPGETVHSNARDGVACLSICVPTYRDDPCALIARLAELTGIERCTLLVYDDGTHNVAMTERLCAIIDTFPAPARLITAAKNAGRSHARNRLIARAEAEWLLLLDADMLPDDRGFLACYLSLIDTANGPSLVAGGFSLEQVDPRPSQRLHAAQAAKSDCLTATERAQHPGRYVFTSNILVHREILESIAFDEGYAGWGWEDVDWGLRVAGDYPVLHVDNTATHTGLESDAALLAKFGASGGNFARLLARHPDSTNGMPLTRIARRLKYVPFLKPIARAIAATRFLPISLRLLGLKVYRACAYAKYI